MTFVTCSRSDIIESRISHHQIALFDCDAGYGTILRDRYGIETLTVDKIGVDNIHKNASEYIAKGMLLVICDANLNPWFEACSMLGLRYERDYMDIFSLIAYLDKTRPSCCAKKFILMYGNCQMHDYYDCLNRCQAFRGHYSSIYFKYLEYPRWREDRLAFLLSYCDILIYVKELFDQRFRNCYGYVRRNNPGCLCIGIPPYSFRGYFPQTNAHIQEHGEYDIVQEAYNPFHREDMFINDRIKEGYSAKEIYEKMIARACFSKDSIKRAFEMSLKQLSAMDRVSAVQTHDFVLDQYQNSRLFKDPVHLSDALVWHVTRQLLAMLECEAPSANLGPTIHYFTELPVYPEVAEALSLRWWNSVATTELRLNNGMLSVSLEEYVARYCQFCKNAKAIRESLYFGDDAPNIMVKF